MSHLSTLIIGIVLGSAQTGEIVGAEPSTGKMEA